MSHGVLWMKACARGGCTAIVKAKGPKTLDRVRFCSSRCSALENLRNGWRPPRLSVEEMRARGKRGGKARGVTMHKRRICVLFLYGAILDGIFRQLKRIADALEKRP